MRYVSEISLRLEGNRDKAAQYIPRARVVVGELWNQDIELGGNDQAWRTVTLEGGDVVIEVRIARTLPPYVRIFAAEKPEDIEIFVAYSLFVAWYPEGIMLTPTSAAYEDGRGLPSRNPETGTKLSEPTGVDPVQPHILINRFPNNKYLDRGDFVVGTQGAARVLSNEPGQLRDSYDDEFVTSGQEFRYWPKNGRPYGYTPEQGEYLGGPEYWAANTQTTLWPTVPGEYVLSEEVIDGDVIKTALLVTEQKERISGADNIFEGESASWYTHRPEEILYPTAGHEAIFLRTNEYRAAVGRPPMHRQLRGDANPADIAVKECAISGDFSHNSADFRPGHRIVSGKVLVSTGLDDSQGENLTVGGVYETPSEESGNFAAGSWRQSFGHYLNMINDNWNNTAGIPGAQHSVGWTEATVNRTTEDIPGIAPFPDDTEITGGIWAQLFHKRETWTTLCNEGYDGDYGFVGWNQPTDGVMNNEMYLYADPETFAPTEPRAYVMFRGIRYSVPNTEDDTSLTRLLGASVYNKTTTEADGTVSEALWFRVMMYGNIGLQEFVDNGTLPVEYTKGSKVVIFTAPVGLTESAYVREDEADKLYPGQGAELLWEVEGEFDLPFSADKQVGWTFLAHGQAAISPDGRKMCFSHQWLQVEEQTFLSPNWNRDVDAPTPPSDPSTWLYPIEFYERLSRRPTRDIAVQYIIHIEKEVDSGWVQHRKESPMCETDQYSGDFSPTEGFTANNQYYRRRLDTSYDYIPIYSDDNELEYITIEIDERQECSWTEHWYYRLAFLKWPDGKEFLYDFCVLEDAQTPENPLSRAYARGARNLQDNYDTCFTATIHSINPYTQDVVFTRTTFNANLFVPNDDGTFLGEYYAFGVIGVHGKTEYAVDLGNGNDRVRKTLISHLDSELDVDDVYTMRYSKLLYEWYINTGTQAVVLDGFGATLSSVQIKYGLDTQLHCYRHFNQASYIIDGDNDPFFAILYPSGFYQWKHSEFDNVWFNSIYDNFIDEAYSWDWNSPSTKPISAFLLHAEDYRTAVWNPPLYLAGQFPDVTKALTPQPPSLYSEEIEALHDAHNIAPKMCSVEEAITRVVRYRDRVILKCSMEWPVGSVRKITPETVGPYNNSTAARRGLWKQRLFEEGDVVDSNVKFQGDEDKIEFIWSNFDLDAAAEMADVTDIEPFGRAV